MQLVDLSTYPRDLAGKVYFIAQNLSCLGIRPQRVHRAAHYRTGLLLVVKDAECRGDHDGGEDREGLQPSRHTGRYGGKGSVCAALHERAGAGAWGGDERSSRGGDMLPEELP